MSTKRRTHRYPGETPAAFTLVAPVIVLFTVTRVLPALWTFYLSFTDYAIARAGRWVGLANYRSALEDPLFLLSLKNTLVYAVSTTVVSTGIALCLAMALDLRLKASRWVGLAYFSPVVVSIVATSSVWIYILNPDFGILNYLLSEVELPQPAWLNDAHYAMPTMIAIGAWQNIGYSAMIYLAGLQAIPRHIEEAAIVDGAGRLRRFFRITWPLLRPTTTLILILTGLTTLQAFDQVVVLTNGGPADSTTTAVHQIYRNAFLFLKFGKAAAMSFVFFAILLGLSVVALRRDRRAARYQA